MSIVEEEADESLYWMDLLIDSGLVPSSHLDELMSEGKELLAMTVASIRTSKAGNAKDEGRRSNQGSAATL
jgi:four helix bundle protein